MILQAPRCNNTIETKSGSSNGKGRAFELGSELQISPIVVEDLEHPGHMLIEVCSLQVLPPSPFSEPKARLAKSHPIPITIV